MDRLGIQWAARGTTQLTISGVTVRTNVEQNSVFGKTIFVSLTAVPDPAWAAVSLALPSGRYDPKAERTNSATVQSHGRRQADTSRE
jgi:hypothetical protein